MSEAKGGQDIERYERALGTIRQVAPGEKEAVPDTTWLENKKRNVIAETNRLEAELKGYKNNLIKESIRVCPCIRYLRCTH